MDCLDLYSVVNSLEVFLVWHAGSCRAGGTSGSTLGSSDGVRYPAEAVSYLSLFCGYIFQVIGTSHSFGLGITGLGSLANCLFPVGPIV